MHRRKILPPTNQNAAERNDLSPNLQTPLNLTKRLSLTLRQLSSTPHSLPPSPLPSPPVMASTRSVARLVAYRRSPFMPIGSTANFSSSVSRAATPAGPPQPGFRLPPPQRWDTSPESSLDKASKYFLLAEIFRGMYVTLEQYFKPP